MTSLEVLSTECQQIVKGLGYQWHPFLGMHLIRTLDSMNPSRNCYQKLILPSTAEPPCPTTGPTTATEGSMEFLRSSILGSNYISFVNSCTRINASINFVL
uniref:Uncharacterized protein n=1 Tax=Opuntia streptacantha TaxID=393608 RepID=A0A7C8ZKV3_OPUST